MASENLGTWAQGKSYERICDVILQLQNIALAGKTIGDDPTDVLVSDSDIVTVADAQANAPKNYAYQAPEVLSALLGGRRRSAPSIREPQRLFTLGMMAYQAIRGESPYQARGVSLLNLDECVKDREFLVAPWELTTRDSLGGALSRWLAIDPQKRADGVNMFKAYLQAKMPATVRLRYVCNGQTVCWEKMMCEALDDPILIMAGQAVQLRGEDYRYEQDCEIAYRPGSHDYDLPVRRVSTTGGVGGTQQEEFTLAISIPRKFMVGAPAGDEDPVRLISLTNTNGAVSKEYTLEVPDTFGTFPFYLERVRSDGVVRRKSFTLPVPRGAKGMCKLSFEYRKVAGRLSARITPTSGATRTHDLSRLLGASWE